VSEEPSDSGSFVITGPVWVLVERDSVKLDDQLRIKVCGESSGILRVTTSIGSAVLVFTDQDLAERHAKIVGEANITPATFDTPGHFFMFLRWMEKTLDTPYVLFDPGDKSRPNDKIELIDKFLRGVKEG